MRTRLGVFVVVAALTLSGCGFGGGSKNKVSTTTTTVTGKATTTYTTVAAAAHNPVVVDKSGYTVYSDSYSSSKAVSMALIVKNPNPVATAIGVHFDVLTYSEQNKLLSTESEEIPYIYPGQSAAFGKIAPGKDVGRIEFSPITTGWVNGPPPGELTVGDVRSTTTTFSTAYADVTSTFAVAIERPVGTIVFFDGAGKLLGGASDTPASIPANSATTVSLRIPKVPPLTKASTMYVSAPSFVSLFRNTLQVPPK